MISPAVTGCQHCSVFTVAHMWNTVGNAHQWSAMISNDKKWSVMLISDHQQGASWQWWPSHIGRQAPTVGGGGCSALRLLYSAAPALCCAAPLLCSALLYSASPSVQIRCSVMRLLLLCAVQTCVLCSCTVFLCSSARVPCVTPEQTPDTNLFPVLKRLPWKWTPLALDKNCV